jgi:hypothetical protein
MERNTPFVSTLDGKNIRRLKALETAAIINIVWSPKGDLYITARNSGNEKRTIWRMPSDYSNIELITKEGFVVTDVTPDGKYLLGREIEGEQTGIHLMHLDTKKIVSLVPDVATAIVRMAPDNKSFLYALEKANEILFYKAPLKDGKLVGQPEIVLKVPFVFLFMMEGNAYDFTRDLSTIIFAQPTMQADLYLLSY